MNKKKDDPRGLESARKLWL